MPNIPDQAIAEIITLLQSRIEGRLTTATFNKVRALLGQPADDDTHRVEVPAGGRMT